MPAYKYQCNECGRDFSIKKPADNKANPNCPVCESPNVNLLNAKEVSGGGCSSSSCGSCGGGCSSCG